MAKEKNKKEYFWGEDLLFLMLKLIDYPHKEKKSFNFSELSRLEFRDFLKTDLLTYVLFLQDRFYLSLRKQNKNIKKDSEFWKLAKNEKSFQKARSFFNANSQNDNEDFLRGIDFRIEMRSGGRRALMKTINDYIEKFIRGELIYSPNKAISFDRQKERVLATIEKQAKKSETKNIFLDNSELGEEFNFLECMLALEMQKKIRIDEIVSTTGKVSKAYYRVFFELKINSKNLKKGKISFKSKDGKGYLKRYDNDKGIEIGRANSKKYKLLKLLANPLGCGRPIEVVFEKIYSSFDNSNIASKDKLSRVRGLVSELQRDRKLKKAGLQIEIKNEKSIWMDYKE